MAPGQLVILKGRGIGPTTRTDANLTATGLFPTTLAGVQVTFNGILAPLISVEGAQIECQAPFELDGAATATIQVRYNDQSSNTYVAVVVAQQVSVLAVANADGTPNSVSNPAQAGAVVTIYLTGIGQTLPTGADSALSTLRPMKHTANSLRFSLNGRRPATRLFFGGAPGESNAGVSAQSGDAPTAAWRQREPGEHTEQRQQRLYRKRRRGDLNCMSGNSLVDYT